MFNVCENILMLLLPYLAVAMSNITNEILFYDVMGKYTQDNILLNRTQCGKGSI